MRGRAQRYGIAIATGLLLVVLLALCFADARREPASKRSTLAAKEAEPDHYYVARRGTAFEYAKIPTNDSTDESFVLVWDDGTHDSEPVVRYQDGASNGTLTCYDGCQFVYGTTLVDGKMVQSGRIRVTNDPLVYEIMHDAAARHLSSR